MLHLLALLLRALVDGCACTGVGTGANAREVPTNYGEACAAWDDSDCLGEPGDTATAHSCGTAGSLQPFADALGASKCRARRLAESVRKHGLFEGRENRGKSSSPPNDGAATASSLLSVEGVPKWFRY